MWNEVFLNLAVNKKAMRLFGIETATYWAELANVLKRVIEKGTANSDGYFHLDRNYIERELGLNLEQQYHCDSILVRANVLSISPESRDLIAVDCDRWIAIISSEDTKLLADVQKKSVLPKTILEKDARAARRVADEQAREAKAAGIRTTMKNIVKQQAIISGAPEVEANLLKWVDSVYDSKKFLNRTTIEVFCSKIAEFSRDNVVRAELIQIAAARGYNDATYVFDLYSRSHASNPTKPVAQQKIAVSVNENYGF